jgi:hypothetical protein
MDELTYVRTDGVTYEQTDGITFVLTDGITYVWTNLHICGRMELYMYRRTYITMKGRQLEQNFEELNPASHVPILGTILNLFDVFVAVFSLLNSLNLVECFIY